MRQVKDPGKGFEMKRFNDLTPAEKAKHTKMYRKLDAERESILTPYRDAFWQIAEPLWKERNERIDVAESTLNAKIVELKRAFELEKQQIMDEYANNLEYKALDEIYEAKKSETWNHLFNQMEILEKELGLK